MLKSEEIINKIKKCEKDLEQFKKDLILALEIEKISKFKIQIEEINKSKNLECAFSYKKNCSGETKARILNGCGNSDFGMACYTCTDTVLVTCENHKNCCSCW